jgi:hypothetical protein
MIRYGGCSSRLLAYLNRIPSLVHYGPESLKRSDMVLCPYSMYGLYIDRRVKSEHPIRF